MTADLLALADLVDPARIRDLVWGLVSTPSPTGDTDRISAVYGDALKQSGLKVEVRRPLPDHPLDAVVVARFAGRAGGRTVEFNGHLDHVHVHHSAPRWDGDRLSGRGAADMKGAMAAFAEAARVLALPQAGLPGSLLIVAHGMHEAPIGHGEDLQALNRLGVHGDAAIIGELGEDYLCLIQKGMGIYEITIRRTGEPTHELYTQHGTPNPLVLGARIVSALDDLNGRLSGTPIEFVGPESCFVGIATGGDFYNRFPTRFHITGTRRYSPDRSYEDVRSEIARLIEEATGIRPNEPGDTIAIDYELQKVKDGFRVGADQPIAQAVAEASRLVTGHALPPGGSSIVGDGPLFVNEAGVPAICHGPRGHGAHADHEWIDLDELVRVAREYVVAAMLYLRSA